MEMTALEGTGAVTTLNSHAAAVRISHPLLTTHLEITGPAKRNPRSSPSFGINLSSRHHCDVFVLFCYTHVSRASEEAWVASVPAGVLVRTDAH